jgi:hypothetical protein
MTSKGFLLSRGLLVGLAAVAGLSSGCQSPAKRGEWIIWTSTANEGDYRNVEVQEPSDPKESKAQMQRQIQEFRQQGWVIFAVSEPLPQPNGTTLRRYTLRRPQ